MAVIKDSEIEAARTQITAALMIVSDIEDNNPEVYLGSVTNHLNEALAHLNYEK